MWAVQSTKEPEKELTPEEAEELAAIKAAEEKAKQPLVRPFAAEVPARFPMLSVYSPPLAAVLNTSMHIAKRDANVKPARLVTQLSLSSSADEPSSPASPASSLTHAAAAQAMSRYQQQQQFESQKNRDVPYASNTLNLASYNHQHAPRQRMWMEPKPENLAWCAELKAHQIGQPLEHLRVPAKTINAFSDSLLRRILSYCPAATLLDAACYVNRHWHLVLLRDLSLKRHMLSFEPPPELSAFLPASTWPNSGIVNYLTSGGGIRSERARTTARDPMTTACSQAGDTPVTTNVTTVKKQSALRAAIVSPEQAPFHFATPSLPYPWVGVDFGVFRVSVSSYCMRTAYRSRPSSWRLEGTRDDCDDWNKCKWEILDVRSDDKNTQFLIREPQQLPPVAVLSSPMSSDLVHRALKRRFSMRSTRLGVFDTNTSSFHEVDEFRIQAPDSPAASVLMSGSPRRFSSDFGRSIESDDDDQGSAFAESSSFRAFSDHGGHHHKGERSPLAPPTPFAPGRTGRRAQQSSRKKAEVAEFVWGHFEVNPETSLQSHMHKQHQQAAASRKQDATAATTTASTTMAMPGQALPPGASAAQTAAAAGRVVVLREGYRRLRVVQCGRNASWGLEFHLCGFEVYGSLFRAKQPSNV